MNTILLVCLTIAVLVVATECSCCCRHSESSTQKSGFSTRKPSGGNPTSTEGQSKGGKTTRKSGGGKTTRKSSGGEATSTEGSDNDGQSYGGAVAAGQDARAASETKEIIVSKETKSGASAQKGIAATGVQG